MATLHLIIRGKVQGVFFRVSARKAAVQMGVTGWVKNTPEKQVEIIARGSNEQLEKFTDWCRNGPSDAHVENVSIEEIDDQQFDEFKILH